MTNMRLKVSRVVHEEPILKMEVAAQSHFDLEEVISLIVRTIEISVYFKGHAIPPDDEYPFIEPQVDEEYPIASGCFLKFKSQDDAIRFVKSIDPNNG